MIKQLPCRILLSCAGLLALAASCTGLGPAGAQFTLEVQGESNQVLYRVDNGAAIFEITSPTGMGNATVELVAEKLPEKLILRFYLQGLEDLRFTYGTTTVSASVPTGTPDLILENVKTAEGEDAVDITPDSPYWMDVRLVPASEGGSSSTPQPGYFEVVAPEDFLAGPYRGFSIRWLDFYR
jgi:hypothetical protein